MPLNTRTFPVTPVVPSRSPLSILTWSSAGYAVAASASRGNSAEASMRKGTTLRRVDRPHAGDDLIGAIGAREAQRVGGDATAVVLAHLDVRPVVDATVEPRDAGLLAHGLELGRAGGEEVGEHGGRRGRERRVPRRVGREVRQADGGLDPRVERARPRVEI